MTIRLLLCLLLASSAPAAGFAQNKRETAVRKDREKVAKDVNWIYNDLAKAEGRAKSENKPMLVVIRCVP